MSIIDKVDLTQGCSSTYNVSFVIYDPYSKTSKIVDVPGLTNTGSFNYTEYHMNGVDYDKVSGDMYLTASSAVAFTGVYTGDYSSADYRGPNRVLRYSPRTKEVVANVNLMPTQDEYFKKQGHRTSGFQDLAETSNGDVYAIGTFGNSIVKIPYESDHASLWYAPEHYNKTYGFGGILSLGDTLVVSDTLTGGLVTFDTCQSIPVADEVPLQNLPADYRPAMADSLFAPSKYDGRVALWSDDYNGTAVLGSNDGWGTATFLGLVPTNAEAKKAGGLPVATFEMGESIFALVNYFSLKLPVQDKKSWPIYDITADVDRIIQRSNLWST